MRHDGIFFFDEEIHGTAGQQECKDYGHEDLDWRRYKIYVRLSWMFPYHCSYLHTMGLLDFRSGKIADSDSSVVKQGVARYTSTMVLEQLANTKTMAAIRKVAI